jgi:hypothetical protein
MNKEIDRPRAKNSQTFLRIFFTHLYFVRKSLENFARSQVGYFFEGHCLKKKVAGQKRN